MSDVQTNDDVRICIESYDGSRSLTRVNGDRYNGKKSVIVPSSRAQDAGYKVVSVSISCAAWTIFARLPHVVKTIHFSRISIRNSSLARNISTLPDTKYTVSANLSDGLLIEMYLHRESSNLSGRVNDFCSELSSLILFQFINWSLSLFFSCIHFLFVTTLNLSNMHVI